MFIVRNSKNEVEIMCSRKEDAMAFATSIDESYTIEDMSEKEMDEYILRMAEEYEDGIGEGMVR